MSAEDDPTPQRQAAPRYLSDFGSSPLHPSSDPAIYLPSEATLEENHLVEQLDRHHSAPAPVLHVAKVALRVRRVERFCADTVHAVNELATAADPRTQRALESKVAAVDGTIKTVRRFAMAALGSAAVALSPTAYRLLDHSAAAGAETQKVHDLEGRADRQDSTLRDIQGAQRELQTQLFELQRELARRSSVEPLHPGATALNSGKGPLP